MHTKELGLQPDQIVALPLRSESTREKALLLKELLLKLPEVENVAITLRKPSTGAWGSGFRRSEWEVEDRTHMKYNDIGYDYLPTLQIELSAGRNFSAEHTTDIDGGVIINAEAVSEFGWSAPEEAIGEVIFRGNDELTIVGVTANFHFQPMWVDMQPMVMALTDEGSQYLLVRIATNRIEEAIASLDDVWNSVNPDWPISYSFLDRDYAELYASETRFGRMFGGFTLLALFIAALGLFGLASFSLERRRKEMGIRKALGASGGNIALLLSIDVAKLVLLANVVAWPIAYYGVYQWLQNYPFKTQIALWMFAVAGASAIFIALVSITYHAFRASRSNPVESLRCE